MFKTLKNAWNIPDIRRKILITLLMLLVYRIGSFIPTPGINGAQIKDLIESQSGGFLSLLDAISGGAFKQASIFAMSITPYINASIIIQLLTIAIPSLERLSKEGEDGRKILAQYTRYSTVVLGFIQAAGLYLSFRSILVSNDFLTFATVTLSLTAGTAFLMWLGEQITEYGIGNGISLLIFAGIVSRLPSAGNMLYQNAASGGLRSILFSGALVVVMVLAVAAVVWVQKAERRIPIQYAKRVVGRKMYGGQSTHIPIKVSLAGVIPIIFALSIMMFPAQIISMFTGNNPSGLWKVIYQISLPGSGAAIQYTIMHSLLYTLLIVAFTFFYTIVIFNPIEVANTIKKNGGFIPGIRAGKPTVDYIQNVLNRITWFGAFFLALIAILPVLIQQATSMPIYFGGTALLIVVGVALDTVRQLESQLVMRHYKGFLE